jgi:hypothetical protein
VEQQRLVESVSPGCAATMAPRACTVWTLAAARHK